MLTNFITKLMCDGLFMCNIWYIKMRRKTAEGELLKLARMMARKGCSSRLEIGEYGCWLEIDTEKETEKGKLYFTFQVVYDIDEEEYEVIGVEVRKNGKKIASFFSFELEEVERWAKREFEMYKVIKDLEDYISVKVS